jgi:peptidoglycan/xylan/chitin deacetylase (PgdA/CDA1 family)
MQTRAEAYLTISVDDGHPADLRSAELLTRFGLRATFYVPARNPERPLLPAGELRQIARDFELGSHTFNHAPLHRLESHEARREIAEGKAWLEDAIGAGVKSFCYPRGKFHAGTVQLVREAGFQGARTCMFNLNDWPDDPFRWGLSTHAYSHSAAVQVRHAALERNFRGVLNFVVTHRLARDWPRHFELALDAVERSGGIAHLYFHSWEIAAQNQWPLLERVLEQASRRTAFRRLTNGQLFDLWHTRVRQGPESAGG